MQVFFNKQFEKDLSKIQNKSCIRQVFLFIEKLESINMLYQIPEIKKLNGFESFYRYKIKNYRIGFRYIKGKGIILDRILSRENIYKLYP